MESPKGLASAFMLMCPSMQVIEDVTGMLARAFAALAPTIWTFSWAIVLALLFLARRLVFADGRPDIAAAVVIVAVVILLAAEQVAFARANRMALLGKSPAERKLSATSNKGFAYYAAISHSARRSRDGAAAIIKRTSASGTSRGKQDVSTDVKAVRKAIIRIEAELYGNEVSEGLLPTNLLGHRVQKLCDEVGVAHKADGSVADMLRVLKLVELEVGIE